MTILPGLIPSKLIASCVAVITIGMVGVGCTSTRVNEVTASTTHNSTAPTQVAPSQVAPIQEAPVKTAKMVAQPPASQLPGIASYSVEKQVAENPLEPVRENQSSDPARSGVIYEPPVTTTRSLAPINPLSALPQTQLAKLESAPADLQTEADAMAYVDPNSPESLAQQRIDALYPSMQHATCKGGWATPPDRLDAKRETVGHPYYMEMRLRNTPLLPVGHTYIAYGRLSPEGKILNEHVVMLSPVGGYGGAAVAAALPMPGILKPVADDCRIKPHAAYRVSLTAEQFEKLLLRIQKAQQKIPAYALFAYNCNHFASDIAASVGILPPKNIYLPAVKYIYGVIEANEGYNPKKINRG